MLSNFFGAKICNNPTYLLSCLVPWTLAPIGVPTPCQIDVKSCTNENLDLKLLIKHQTKVATMLNEQMVKFLSLMKELNL
jgi:hypothetical protein